MALSLKNPETDRLAREVAKLTGESLTAAEIVAVTPEQADAALEAFRRFGKRRHRAALNIGDCRAYAAARVTGERLLFKGDDFAHTDIPSALPV
jgi:uncharacterized protein with PIN domain